MFCPPELLTQALFYKEMNTIESNLKFVIEICNSFKIGKTGKTVEERRNEEDYKEKYPYIMETSISSKSDSIQVVYDNYLNNRCIVNRKYQRKLVWTQEKR